MSKKILFDDFLKQQQLLAQQQGYRNGPGSNYQYNQGFQADPNSYQNYQAYDPSQYQYNPNQYQYNPNAQSFNFQSPQYDGTPGPESGVSSGVSTPNAYSSTASLASLNTALNKLSVDSPLAENLAALQSVAKISEARKEAEAIASKVVAQPSMKVVEEWKLLEVLKSLSKPKNLPIVRESALLIVQQLALKLGGNSPKEAHLLPFLSLIHI